MKMGREKMNKRTFMQMRCIFLLVCVICVFSPASAEDGLVEVPFAEYGRTVTLSEREALELLFDSTYPDKGNMVDIKLYFENEHYGYEFRRKWPAENQLPEELTNYFGLGFNSLSSNGEFYIFRLYEVVYDDEENFRMPTYNFFAVNKNNGKIIEERVDPVEWNKDFPW